jgi:hypothetical protein
MSNLPVKFSMTVNANIFIYRTYKSNKYYQLLSLKVRDRFLCVHVKTHKYIISVRKHINLTHCPCFLDLTLLFESAMYFFESIEIRIVECVWISQGIYLQYVSLPSSQNTA